MQQYDAIKKNILALPDSDKKEILAYLELSLMKDEVSVSGVLSSGQRQVWVSDNLSDLKGLYNIPCVFRLSDDINHKEFIDIIRTVFAKEEQLHAYITIENDQPKLMYQEKLLWDVVTIKLEKKLPKEIVLSEHKDLTEFFLKPFDLNLAPLFRVGLVTAEGVNYLLLCFHHIIIDGWSIMQLLAKVAEAYSGDYKIQSNDPKYSEYIAYERCEAQKERYQKNVDYWLASFSGGSLKLNLPYSFPEKKRLSGRGKVVYFALDDALQNEIRNFGTQYKFSINHILLACFHWALHVYSRQQTHFFGIPVSIQPQGRWSHVAGNFVNTALHSFSIDQSNNFLEHVTAVKKKFNKDMGASSVPFDQLIGEFYQKGVLQEGDLFNVLYNFVQSDTKELLKNLMVPHHVLMSSSKFPLSLHVYLDRSQLSLFFEYSIDLFDQTIIQAMQTTFTRIIKQIVKEPFILFNDVMFSSEENLSVL